MVLRHKFNVVGHKFNVVGHESLAQCSTNENEGNLQKNECSSSRSGENTEQTEIRGKPSHDSWLELSILVLTEPSLFQSRGFSDDPPSIDNANNWLLHSLTLVINISSGFFATATAIQVRQIHDEPDEVHALKRRKLVNRRLRQASSIVVASPRPDQPSDGIGGWKGG